MIANITIRQSSVDDVKPARVATLVTLINSVYNTAEASFWHAGHQRTTHSQLTKILEDELLLIAEMHDRIVGLVQVGKRSEQLAEFGMLVADPEYRKLKIGSQLVNAAEQWARAQGCNTMRLELLTSTESDNSGTQHLYAWYTRIGYEKQFIVPFEEMYPIAAKYMKVKCLFTVYQKTL